MTDKREDFLPDEAYEEQTERLKLKVWLEGQANEFVDSLTREDLENCWDPAANGFDDTIVKNMFAEWLYVPVDDSRR
jgi:hypothetical protein